MSPSETHHPRIAVRVLRRRLAGMAVAFLAYALVSTALELAAWSHPGSLFASHWASAHAASIPRSENATIRFRIGTDIFAISNDYVWAHSGRDGAFIRDPNLRMLFPGLSPVKKNDPILREGPWAGGRLVTVVFIEAQDTWYERTFSEVISDSIASGKFRSEREWLVYFGGPQGGSEVYVPKDSAGGRQYIQCTRDSFGRPSGSCLKYTYVTPRTVARIRFSKSMLDRASDIEAEIVTFLRAALQGSSNQ